MKTTLELTLAPGSEEYKKALLKECIGKLSYVREVREV